MAGSFWKGVLVAWAAASFILVVSGILPALVSDPHSLFSPEFFSYQVIFWSSLVVVLALAVFILAWFLDQAPGLDVLKTGALFGTLYALPYLLGFLTSVLSDLGRSLEPSALSLGALFVFLFQLFSQIGAFVVASVLFRRFSSAS